ncbi:MAG: hypothetical protein ACD_49C00037G0004 [uncultured bacterium (gcode 4)]|uniref:Uncharacterized protein n=1 Tax=uncultured bacterium (gcode 4) TaxID=1234023 RepID=K2AES4_9BACT|nr:MAG: hypothetical protein ACD_49C00037G0004 [uncultured bacterium (gcode 4)]
MDKREKQKVIRWIVLNSLWLFICLLIVFLYIVPSYGAIGDNYKTWNDLFSNIERVKSTWLSIDEVQAKFNQEKIKWVEALFKDKEKVTELIKKPSDYSKDYVSWINEELLKSDTITKEIKESNQIIWNIIPTLNDFWDKIKVSKDSPKILNKINMDSFISFMEDKVLKKYLITSYTAIWIDNIDYDINKDLWLNIWTFKLSLDFEGNISNIRTMVRDFQNSWKVRIENWKLVGVIWSKDDEFSSLNNLLITIENLQISDFSSENKLVKATMTLQFYVKWVWLQDYILVKDALIKETNDLATVIKNAAKTCEKWNDVVCKQSDWNEAVYNIKSLLSQINSIKEKTTELQKNMKIENIDKEFSTLFQIYSSLKRIKGIYDKNMTTINKLNKVWQN